jgi:hypothetical protein
MQERISIAGKFCFVSALLPKAQRSLRLEVTDTNEPETNRSRKNSGSLEEIFSRADLYAKT